MNNNMITSEEINLSCYDMLIHCIRGFDDYEVLLEKILLDYTLMDKMFQEMSLKFWSDFEYFCKFFSSSNYFEELFEKYKRKMYLNFFGKQDIYDNLLIDALILVFEDALRLANKKFYEIKYVTSGSFCDVYQAENILFKIGIQRYTPEISGYEDFVYPLFRKYIPELNLFIEITSLVETKYITNEDVYQMYKTRRKKGYIWIDAREENLGRLINDNHSYGFFVHPETVGFKGNETYKLKKGELAILDTDLDYKEDEVPWEYLHKHIKLDSYYTYEFRYQEELKLELTKKTDV